MLLGAVSAIAILIVGVPAAIILGSSVSHQPKEISFQEFRVRFLRTRRVERLHVCGGGVDVDVFIKRGPEADEQSKGPMQRVRAVLAIFACSFGRRFVA